MTELEKLEGNVVALKATLKERQRRRREIQRDLDAAEDAIISVKESIKKAEDEVETYKNTRVLTTVDEDARAADIEAFRGRIPAAMKVIEEQDRKKAEREARSELDSFKDKVNNSIAKTAAAAQTE